MLNHVLVAAVAGSVLIGGAIQSCRGDATLQRVNGEEPSTAVAVHTPEDADLVLGLLVEARRLVRDTPEEALIPAEVVPTRVWPDGSRSMDFPSGVSPLHLHTVFLVSPNDSSFSDVPVWYGSEAGGTIFFCPECLRDQPYAPQTLGLLYLRARYLQSHATDVVNDETALAYEMQATLLMLDVLNRASQGAYQQTLNHVLSRSDLSERVTPESPWRVPSDDGWTEIMYVWPWPLHSISEQYEADDIVHLTCALLQGKTSKQRRQAFLTILEYTAQGC